MVQFSGVLSKNASFCIFMWSFLSHGSVLKMLPISTCRQKCWKLGRFHAVLRVDADDSINWQYIISITVKYRHSDLTARYCSILKCKPLHFTPRYFIKFESSNNELNPYFDAYLQLKTYSVRYIWLCKGTKGKLFISVCIFFSFFFQEITVNLLVNVHQRHIGFHFEVFRDSEYSNTSSLSSWFAPLIPSFRKISHTLHTLV